MAWNTSDRRDRLPDDWAIRRVRVLRRDAYRCQAHDSQGVKCDQHGNQVDHIERGDNHDLTNLQTLCEWHHKQKTAQEAAEARKAKGFPTQKREPEEHPLARAKRLTMPPPF